MNRKQGLALVAAGTLAWLMVLVMMAPASLVPALLGEVSGLRLEQARGSLWRGDASLVAPSGMVGDVSWDLHGPSLLAGKLRLALSLTGREAALRTTVDHALFADTTHLSGIDGHLSMALLARLTGIEQLVDADIAVDAVTVRLRERRLQAIEGVARLRDVTLLYPRRTLLGQYTLQLGNAGDWMQAVVVGFSGPMSAAGEVALTATGEWRMDLRLQADDPTGDIARGLEFVGPADERGWRYLVYSGQL